MNKEIRLSLKSNEEIREFLKDFKSIKSQLDGKDIELKVDLGNNDNSSYNLGVDIPELIIAIGSTGSLAFIAQLLKIYYDNKKIEITLKKGDKEFHYKGIPKNIFKTMQKKYSVRRFID